MSPQQPSISHEWRVADAGEDAVRRLAERIALKVAVGDLVALHGDLGAGKTTFARAFVRAVLADPEAEVPSPTFSLVQVYAAERLEIAHCDLYRLAGEDELAELGLDEALAVGAALVEWPERAPHLIATNRLDIHLSQCAAADERSLRLVGGGTWAPRLARLEAMSAFLDRAPPWDGASAVYLQGDASARAYARLVSLPQAEVPSPLWKRLGGGDSRASDIGASSTAGLSPQERGRQTAILMDQPRQPDGPPIRAGLPYSRIAHLAEDVRPFVAVAAALREAGLAAPEIYAADLDRGFLLLEDFGDRVFGREVAKDPTRQPELWRAATEALLILARHPVPKAVPLPDGSEHRLPRQDRAVLGIEVELLADWYWPALHGGPIPAEARREVMELWDGLFARIEDVDGWVLRDFHSPNLVWRPGRDGPRSVGLLDFQDALKGSLAYDLVSLLQDARVDVPAALEDELLDHYLAVRARERGFDAAAFRFAYAALGVQRNTKILGIFARLAMRDGKRAYLRHIPRIWRYLARGLTHPDLATLARWFDRHFPETIRARAPSI